MAENIRCGSMILAAFHPLSGAAFRNLWLAEFTANIGVGAQTVAMTWLLIDKGAGPALIASVNVAMTIPMLVFSFAGGTFADIHGYRSVQLSAQALMCTASLSLIALSATDLLSSVSLLVIAFLAGTAVALKAPVWLASLKTLVSTSDLPAAITLNSMGVNLARAVGPALGGFLIFIWSPTAAVIVNLIAALLFIFMVMRFSPRRIVSKPNRRSIGALFWEALSFSLANPLLRNVLIRTAVIGFASGAILSLLPVLSSSRFAGNAMVLGGLLFTFGLGASSATLVLPTLRSRWSAETLITIGTLLLAFSLFCFAAVPSWAAAIPPVFLCGIGWLMINSTLGGVLHFLATGNLHARTLALYTMAGVGVSAGGGMLWGVVAQHSGLDVAFFASGALLLPSSAMRFFFPIGRIATTAVS